MSQLLHHMVTSTAQTSPAKIAFTDGVTSITYRELDDRSSQLAHLLVQQGLQPGDRVAVFMPRCACLLYTSPSPRDLSTSRMPSSA